MSQKKSNKFGAVTEGGTQGVTKGGQFSDVAQAFMISPETMASITSLCMLAGVLLTAFAGLTWLLHSESVKTGTRSLALASFGAFIFLLGIIGNVVLKLPYQVGEGIILGDRGGFVILFITILAVAAVAAACYFFNLATAEARKLQANESKVETKKEEEIIARS